MIVTFLAFNLNSDVFNIHTPSLFSPKSRETEISLTCVQHQKTMESNNPLAEDGKRVLLRQNETPPYCKSSLFCVISVSGSSAHFVAEFLHCSVKSRFSLQPWDTPLRDPRLKTVPTSSGALYDCMCFLIQTIFFSTAS